MSPLSSIRVIELAGIGPGPYAAMLLADHGAEVIRVERIGGTMLDIPNDPFNRGKKSIALNLKAPGSSRVMHRLIESADVLIEGYRPGVAERLGLGPDTCQSINPGLIYGRMTGWGQTGPLAKSAGHDINYIALSGALAAMGDNSIPPSLPLNLVGDFGGGSMFLVMGILSALIQRTQTGQGAIIDAAMTDGATSLMTMFHGMHAAGTWNPARFTNLLDGSTPFYRTYETSDGRFMAVGALEPQFYFEFISRLGIDLMALPQQFDRASWPRLTELFSQTFKQRTQAEWTDVYEGTDACVSPVLDMIDAQHHPHIKARQSYVNVDGVVQPAPAPRYDGKQLPLPNPPPAPGQDTRSILEDAGFSETDIDELFNQKIVGA